MALKNEFGVFLPGALRIPDHTAVYETKLAGKRQTFNELYIPIYSDGLFTFQIHLPSVGQGFQPGKLIDNQGWKTIPIDLRR